MNVHYYLTPAHNSNIVPVQNNVIKFSQKQNSFFQVERAVVARRIPKVPHRNVEEVERILIVGN